ncbi:ParA family protein [Rhodocytophaga aerolata]|uniref:ParA family protein n=1 Tax=Rhodocytophaga aerolata TaxID=455078 RepID=A0ABT8RIA5_9BACT|nr:ParA family protein [Rhodocytophaga aerolata]MDO1451836.1 ParA family protein [Rhodocytophaga aerolata]
MKTFSVVNQKGGVGKTTTVLNLGAALGKKGRKVLIIDLDSQANLSRSFGIGKTIDKHIGTVLAREHQAKDVIINKGIDIIPSSLELLKYEKLISSEETYQFILEETIKPLQKLYDYCLIDCPPSLSTLTVNALVASDFYLIPLQPEFYSYDGLRTITDFAQKLTKLNPKLQLAGIFPTKYNPNARKRLNHDVIEHTKELFQEKVLSVYIRDNVSLAESPLNQTDVFTYAPESNGAKDYMQLANLIVKL